MKTIIAMLPLLSCFFAPIVALKAQLAITEVMSHPSTNLGTDRVEARSDYWELTNFGTNAIDLSSYLFSDSAGLAGAESTLFAGVTIRPAESIIFAKREIGICENAADFRAWWGGNLSPDVQVHFYVGHGFHREFDFVQLWKGGPVTTLVSRIEIFRARRGYSFTYNPVTGALDTLSGVGERGAFKAAATDDVGSPGVTDGPVALRLAQQPQSHTINAGASTQFTIVAEGLPRPVLRWTFNGIAIPGAMEKTYEIPIVEPSHAGVYSVIMDNGIETLASDPASLEVYIDETFNTPWISVAPADLVVSPGQTASFRVIANGYPVPAYQWYVNGQEIDGAVLPTLLLSNSTIAHSGTYSVRVANQNGATNASALLSVQPKPALRITEMMGARSTNSTAAERGDWWELTSFESYPVNLRGYRFDDAPGVLEGSITITNDVIIQPGESIIFVQDITPGSFSSWWGEENLPANLQFVRYVGNSISAEFDSITLWNAAATRNDDYIDLAEYVHLNPDFTPARGSSLSFWCDGFVEFGTVSVNGTCGAIIAALSDDIGSPGYVTNHLRRVVSPRFIAIRHDANGTHLTWSTVPEQDYELQSKSDWDEQEWSNVSHHHATGREITTTASAGGVQRFYRLITPMDRP